MLKDITIGQFYPTNSLVHKLDPRLKLVALIVYIVIAVIGAVVGFVVGALLGWIPLVGFIVGLVLKIAGTIVDVYAIGGVVLTLLVYFKVLK